MKTPIVYPPAAPPPPPTTLFTCGPADCRASSCYKVHATIADAVACLRVHQAAWPKSDRRVLAVVNGIARNLTDAEIRAADFADQYIRDRAARRG